MVLIEGVHDALGVLTNFAKTCATRSASARQTGARAVFVELKCDPANRLADEAQRSKPAQAHSGTAKTGTARSALPLRTSTCCEVWAAPIKREQIGQSARVGLSRVPHAGVRRGERFRVTRGRRW
jgi:hypothetical protein